MGRRREVWEEEDDETIAYQRRPPPKKSRGWIGWFLFILMLGACGAFVWYLYLPLRKDAQALTQRGVQAADESKKQLAKLQETEGRLSELTKKQEELTGQLVQTVAEKAK